ncbi:MAG TPA: DUF4276 family protein [Candidatus Binataceae bacterium]|jgi:hypothetical protein|nr:DUF4276 family protein [Candidatus Binataceae bacterium]
MVSEVRIYVEGGGEGSESKAAIRQGFGQFLDPLRQLARARRIRWHVVACGGRNAAFDDFRTALRTHDGAFNVLLVDSEGPVSQMPWNHLLARDGWARPAVGDEQCHLMVQCVEAWLMSDRDALQRFYGAGFNKRALPANTNVEAVDKGNLKSGLERATRNTSKGRYHKIHHCSLLLARLDTRIVRSGAAHCDRLFTTLGSCMGATI